jgi:hypothetical protein
MDVVSGAFTLKSFVGYTGTGYVDYQAPSGVFRQRRYVAGRLPLRCAADAVRLVAPL